MTNMPKMKVRVGTPQDVDAVMNVALEACTENGFVSPNQQKLLHEIWPALNLEDGIVGIVGPEEGNEVQGVVLLRVGKMWYGDENVLEEKAVFVHPKYRSAKGGRARKLCEFSKQAADKLNLPLIIGILSTQRTEGKVRLYRRIFGEPAGAFFLYGRKTGSENSSPYSIGH